ncbi:Mu transposase C-terminal domain-containing protein [Actinomadura harenae]|uniref:Integrase n=1 Tax=Actinomadura harenae TaxID=2483351 RepID=A0A3M2L0D2_9ACTN|nr:Mu transposase C-terminal domain-containing protein [Actinomadura harenae]RMI31132.1 integrase [Actinomadura harenae]
MGEVVPRGVVRIADRIRFEGRTFQIVGMDGMVLRLLAEDGAVSAVAAGHVMAATDFELLDHGPDVLPESVLPPLALVDALPEQVVEQARFWERHIVEVITGLPSDAEEGAVPRPEYDPAWRTVMERQAAKVAELTAAGHPTSSRTLIRMRVRYEAEGLWGLVDGRARKAPASVSGTGRADERVVQALKEALAGQTQMSTGDGKRLMHQTEQILAARHGEGVVPLPKKSTFYRLVKALARGNDPFGPATSRRTRALRPGTPFTPSMASRPGEIVQVDSTRLDVMVVLDDGVVARPELSIAVDVATRSICAALLRPAGTKAVDAAVLLARMLVPEPMRPGWSQTLSMAASVLPHERMLAVDARLEQAAAKPVIIPDTIVIDHGKVFVSATFTSACELLGISLQPARPRTPTDKAIVERTFSSINSLFCQYVAGYTGSDVTRRGADPAAEAVWTLPQLQDLLDEWVITWQHRAHDGLRNPYLPGRTLSPNEAYAIAVARAGYLPVALSSTDYIELLPATWRTINDYGIKIDYRTYDDPQLNPLRRQPSGMKAKQDQWEVHYDPYNVTRIWVRRSDDRQWIEVPWTHLPMVRSPFADFTWRHARQLLADQGADDTNETAIARVLARLLTRAGSPPEGSAQVVARTWAALQTPPPLALPAAQPAHDTEPGHPDANEPDEDVVPFGVFNPLEEQENPLW